MTRMKPPTTGDEVRDAMIADLFDRLRGQWTSGAKTIAINGKDSLSISIVREEGTNKPAMKPWEADAIVKMMAHLPAMIALAIVVDRNDPKEAKKRKEIAGALVAEFERVLP